ncbi:hypothetical protein [Microcystis aeruginosa]|nr:hypothetical protein [Microcystis aeruginosa]
MYETLLGTVRNSNYCRGSSDNTIKIWEVAMGTELRTLAGHFE